jgi:glutathione S-transferase
MNNLKLTYFDFDGGRGECARLALTIGQIPFEDERVGSRELFVQMKEKLPYGALPVLTVNGATLGQSNAIARYVGRLTDLYPTDPWQAALCDEVLDTVEEISTFIGSTMFLDEEQKKAKREGLVKEQLPVFLRGLGNRLESSGGGLLRQ